MRHSVHRKPTAYAIKRHEQAQETNSLCYKTARTGTGNQQPMLQNGDLGYKQNYTTDQW